jgi:hypothetical protein
MALQGDLSDLIGQKLPFSMEWPYTLVSLSRFGELAPTRLKPHRKGEIYGNEMHKTVIAPLFLPRQEHE